MESASIEKRIKAGEATLAHFDERIAALEAAECDATRAFADEPNDKAAAAVKAARAELESWRAGRAVAAQTVQAARDELDALNVRTTRARVDKLLGESTHPALNARLAPFIDQIVRQAQTIDDLLKEMRGEIEKQNASVKEAGELAESIGYDIRNPANREPIAKATLEDRRIGWAHARALLMVALTNAGISEELHRAMFVAAPVDLYRQVAQLLWKQVVDTQTVPHDKQIARMLNNEPVITPADEKDRERQSKLRRLL